MLERRGLIIHPHELDEAWLDTMRNMRVNVLGLHPPGGRNAAVTLAAMLDALPRMQPLLERAAEYGLQVEYEMHALSYLMPRTLYARSPDWFRMDECGNRVPDFNLCASSQAALDFLSERAAALAKALPVSTHRYYFWLDDVKGTKCHCPKCAEFSASDQQLLCVNAMLQGIRSVDSQAKLAYIAYQDSLQVPTHVLPAEGVFLEYAPIGRKFDLPITHPDNASEFASLPDLLRFFGTKDAQVLDYWLDNSLYSGWKYPPKPFSLRKDVMRQDISDYRKLGFPSITTFACYLGKDYIDLYGKPDIQAYGQALLS